MKGSALPDRLFIGTLVVALFSIQSSGCADSVATPPAVTGATAQVLQEINRPASERYMPVALMQLIVDPKKYDKQRVLVFGYLSMGAEWQSIYFDAEMYRLGNRDNAIGVDLADGKYTNYSLKDLENFDCHYGSIAGVFMADDVSADIPHAGTLKHVQLITASGNSDCKGH